MDILSKEKLKWRKVKLVSWVNINISDSFLFKDGENVIVVDITQKPWMKQFGIVSRNQIGRISNLYKKYLIHCRCRSGIESNEDGIFHCKKCRHIIPSKDLCFKSESSHRYLKMKDVTIGEALITSDNKKFILIDLDYNRRKDKISTLENTGLNDIRYIS